MFALLEARAVTKIYGGGMRGPRMIAVDDFSLAIGDEPPSITALVGESGSGKTTLARLLLGLVEPSGGAVLYKGADIRTLSGTDLRSFRRDVQVIFQDPFEAYNPFYRVDHVLETPVLNFGLADSRREARRMIEETLRVVGLRPEETLGRYPHQLSGGQRQRIMVARALLIRPRVIIADEPVSMVDASLRATILTSLRELHDKFGISLIYITHDLTTAYQVSQNVIVLYRGLIAEAGDVEKVVGDPKHPYTRLLIGSIPYPDPNRPWTGEEAPSPEGVGAPPEQSCCFAPRCPLAMAVCRESAPPMFRTDRYRAAACFLYREGDVVPRADIGEIMIRSDGPSLARPPTEAVELRPGA
jgi:oligopeptide/dipeptide ABC transporter ATP-binding protein